jgi:CheY-like chemotaxis protein
VLAAVSTQARDPERLNATISQLNNASPDVRAAAVARLRLGGDAAIKALLEVLGDESRRLEFPGVEDAVVALNDLSLPALAAASHDRNSPVGLPAIRMLGRLATPKAELYLFGPALSAGAPPSVQQAAREALTERGNREDAATAAAKLYTRAASLYGQPLRSADNLREAVVLEGDAYSILPTSREVRRLFLSASIEAAGPAAAGAILNDRSIDVVEDLLADALERNAVTVAVAAIGNLGVSASSEELRRRAPQRSILIEAVRHPDRRIRTAAIEAIGHLGAETPYPGSSDVAEAVEFLIRSQGVAKAIVADVRLERARGRSGLLATQGYEAEVASDPRSLLALTATMPDCELILVDMSLAEGLSGKLIASLRRDNRTALVPIGITASTSTFDRAQRLATQFPRVVALIDAPTELAAQQWVAKLQDAGADVQVPAPLRLQEAQIALGWLAAETDRVGRVEMLRQLEPALETALYTPTLGGSVLPLLGDAGTPGGQRMLVELASNATQAIDRRRAAAVAFSRSVERFGTLLTTSEIVSQYDRYNASAAQDGDTQRVLANILDIIEARTAIDSSLASPEKQKVKPQERSRE